MDKRGPRVSILVKTGLRSVCQSIRRRRDALRHLAGSKVSSAASSANFAAGDFRFIGGRYFRRRSGIRISWLAPSRGSCYTLCSGVHWEVRLATWVLLDQRARLRRAFVSFNSSMELSGILKWSSFTEPRYRGLHTYATTTSLQTYRRAMKRQGVKSRRPSSRRVGGKLPLLPSDPTFGKIYVKLISRNRPDKSPGMPRPSIRVLSSQYLQQFILHEPPELFISVTINPRRIPVTSSVPATLQYHQHVVL